MVNIRTSVVLAASVLAAPLCAQTVLGPEVLIRSGSVARPDVAYDESNAVYLVAWDEKDAGGRIQVFAQRVRVDASPVGAPVPIGFGERSATPRVANVRGRARFLVVWQDVGGLFARSVDAATGSAASPALVRGVLPSAYPDADVGGDATAEGNAAVVVWSEADGPRIKGSRVLIDAMGELQVLPWVTLSDNSQGYGDLRPRISDSDGASGRYLVTWEARWAYHPVDRAAVIDRHLELLGRINVSTYADNHAPSAAGDGSIWVEGSLERGELPRCGMVGYQPRVGIPYLGASAYPGYPTASGEDLELAWLGESFLLGYIDHGVARVTSLDASCLLCQGVFDAGSEATEVALASQRSADPTTGDAALIVWIRSPVGATAELRVRAYQGADGVTADLGGGCGLGGKAFASCAITGHAGFAHRLRDAASTASATLILGATAGGSISCGTCVVVPSPAVVIPAGATDALGNAALPMPIPASVSLVGQSLIAQWAVQHESATCTLGLDLSNALEVRLQ